MNLATFDFQDQPVRVVSVNDEPQWVVADVCRVLEIQNPTNAITRLDEDDLDLAEVIDALGRKQSVNVVNEAGLYDLILRSDKPQARIFKRWITHEVLPALRKTGSYRLNGNGSELRAVLEIFAEIVERLHGRPQRRAVSRLIAAAQGGQSLELVWREEASPRWLADEASQVERLFAGLGAGAWEFDALLAKAREIGVFGELLAPERSRMAIASGVGKRLARFEGRTIAGLRYEARGRSRGRRHLLTSASEALTQ